MEYLKAFLQEVLRMYPAAGFFTRTTRFTETIDGVTIPAKTRISLSPYLLQRSPQYWDDPETFLPERWINVSESEANRRRFAFFPFSMGGRNCIGSRFATMEAHMIVAALVRAFRFQIAPSQADTDFKLATVITMRLKPSLKIALEKRA